MWTTRLLTRDDNYSIEDAHIRVDHESWLPAEHHTDYRVMFVRSGTFRLRVNSRTMLVHPVLAYLVRPGDEQQIAHRADVVDECTRLTLSSALMRELTDGAPPPVSQLVLTSGRLDLMHRTTVARARGDGDAFELLERVLRLAEGVIAAAGRPAGRPSRAVAARLTEAARELLAADPVTLSLTETARRLGVSPSYLSRSFHSSVGMSLTRFRTQMRVRQVLDRIESGEQSLARIAADLGFADHAHMSRTVRNEVGHSPSALRSLLAAVPAS